MFLNENGGSGMEDTLSDGLCNELRLELVRCTFLFSGLLDFGCCVVLCCDVM